MSLSRLLLLLSLSACTGTSTETPAPDGTDVDATQDRDGDGYSGDDDCNDADEDVHPGADELCDGDDNDCDGGIDEEPVNGITAYTDADGDGWGDDAATVVVCALSAGLVAVGGDCDDGDADYHPGAPETDCRDPNDYNCDGSIAYADADEDGFAACEECDDGNANVNPDATEVCNGLDDDCDGQVDPSTSTDATTWYTDRDADGHGDDGTNQVACDQPAGTSAVGGDCNDLDPAFNPGATESCDGDDNDCDGDVDEDDAVDAATWYEDGDGDGYGDPAGSMASCAQPDGYVANDDDCDEEGAGVNPGATEVCNGYDDNCDGLADDDDPSVTGTTTYYADVDEDGYGDPNAPAEFCTAPPGYVLDDTDCDDGNATVNPGGEEAAGDGIDSDCDDAETCYADADNDGYTDGTTVESAGSDCDDYGEAYADAPGGDCDDTDSTEYPGAPELCDGSDDDCDGEIDEDDSADARTWYFDGDGDGFGDPAVTAVSCLQPEAYVANDGDCDPDSSAVNPAATELCNGIDDDCDGDTDEDSAVDAPTWYADGDGDGYGSPDASVSCSMPEGHTDNDDDCNDEDGAVSPAAVEVCNGIDDDCDGAVDEDAVDMTTWYGDVDGDGEGATRFTTTACDMPENYSATSTDCDDADPAINSSAIEDCDGIDNDCDGVVDEGTTGGSWYPDADGDGFGDETAWPACDGPQGYVLDATDCDDSDTTVHPYAWEEESDGIDSDCDGADDTIDGNDVADVRAAGVSADDSYTEVSFDHPVATEFPSFPFCGVEYSSAYLITNGRMTFGDADTSFAFDMGELPEDIAVMPAWRDFDLSSDGAMYYTAYADAYGFYWREVPEFGGSSSLNTFSAVLFPDGRVLFQYESVGADDYVISGWSCQPATTPADTVDLSAAEVPAGSWGLGAATSQFYGEEFADSEEDRFDLSGSVIRLCVNVDGSLDVCEE